MIYKVKYSGKFKKNYKLAKKRGMDVKLLVDTGTHVDLFE